MAEKITMRVSEIIKAELAVTVATIADGKPKIDALVTALLERNKLNREEMEGILSK
jgi:ATP-dependent Zn protease